MLAILLTRLIIIGTSIYMVGIGSYYDNTDPNYDKGAYWSFSDPASMSTPVTMCDAGNCAEMSMVYDPIAGSKKITDISFSGNLVITCGADSDLHAAIWVHDKIADVITKTVLNNDIALQSGATSISVSTDGEKIFAVGYKDDGLKRIPVIWTIVSGSPVDEQELALDIPNLYSQGEVYKVHYDGTSTYAVGYILKATAGTNSYVAAYWKDGALVAFPNGTNKVITDFISTEIYE